MLVNTDDYQEVCVAEAGQIFVGAIIYTMSELYKVTSKSFDGRFVTFETEAVIPDGSNHLLSTKIFKSCMFSVYAPIQK